MLCGMGSIDGPFREVPVCGSPRSPGAYTTTLTLVYTILLGTTVYEGTRREETIPRLTTNFDGADVAKMQTRASDRINKA